MEQVVRCLLCIMEVLLGQIQKETTLEELTL